MSSTEIFDFNDVCKNIDIESKCVKQSPTQDTAHLDFNLVQPAFRQVCVSLLSEQQGVKHAQKEEATRQPESSEKVTSGDISFGTTASSSVLSNLDFNHDPFGSC